MNTVSILKKIPGIIEGWTRYALNIRTSIMQYNEENFCKKCPIAYKDGKYSGWCQSSKGGCGCHAGAKTSAHSEVCKKGFWGSNWNKPDEFEKFLNDY